MYLVSCFTVAKTSTCFRALSISPISHISSPTLVSVLLLLPLCLSLFNVSVLTLCLSFLLLSHSLAFATLSFSLVAFEVLNNERATLHVKLIGKSRLKLHGAAQQNLVLGTTREWEGDKAASEVQSACGDNDNGFTEP